MDNKTQPALIAGVAIGLLSSLPFVNIVNMCCCLWAIVGGALAVYLYVNRSATPATSGDGAILGAIAGAVGAAIYLVLGIPLGIMTGNAGAGAMMSMMGSLSPEAAEAMRQQIELMQNQTFSEQLIAALPSALIGAVCIVLFSLVGGLIGVPVFEKRKGDGGMPPPPPPGFGGSGAGGFGNTAGGGGGSNFGAPPPTGGVSGDAVR